MVHYPPWPIPYTIPLGVVGIVGLLASVAGMATGLYALFALDVYPLGWVLFAVSLISFWTMALYTIVWEWDHIPYPEVVPPTVDVDPTAREADISFRP